MTPIADDFVSIAARLKELEKEKRARINEPAPLDEEGPVKVTANIWSYSWLAPDFDGA